MKEMKKDQEESRFLKLRHTERARLQESNSAEEDEEPSFLKLIDTERARLQESNFEEARREWIAEHSLKHEKMLADLGDEMPRRETTSPLRKEATTYLRLEKRWLLDALCRHREILRREINFLRGEVNSRGFATFSGKKAYSESQSNGLMIPPMLFSDLSGSTGFKVVGVNFPHLVTSREESLDLLLRESDHLRYRIQSLASIMRVFGTPVTSDKSKMNLFLMSRAAAMISKTMQNYSKEDTTSPHLLHRAHWESIWGSQMASHGVFDDITTLSPMQFTPSTPGNTPYSATICPALQIYSIQIVELNVNLNWPLRVYGVVAARDTVDRNRNLLFYRSRANYQLVEKDDPFLRLTGPSRAIVAVEPVTFEVELKIKYPGAEHLDTALFSCIYNWRAVNDTTPMFSGFACSAQLSLEQLPRAIQATIVSVRLVEGLWNPNHGCRVSCSLSAEEDLTPREVVLLDCSRRDAAKRCPIGSDGYFGLARNVVSAELQSTMKVVVQTQWLRNGGPQGYVEFPVRQYRQTSKGSCFVGKCEVEIVVAWSLLVKNKLDLML